jgi:predicted TIM-barrel fold metal-dependent hydrolase
MSATGPGGNGVEHLAIVDAHMHLWDLSTGWYRHIKAADESVGLGAPDGLKRSYLLEDYQADTARVPLQKIVHVSAAFPKPGPVAETEWLDALAERVGWPQAIVGTIDLRRGAKDVERQLDAHVRSSRFRGIRVTLGFPYDSDVGRAALAMLAERGLVYDVIIAPDSPLAAATRAAAANPGVPFVLEHMGSPPPSSEPARLVRWQREVADFAAVPSTFCKLSGIAMTLHRFDRAGFRPYIDYCLDAFGPDRCMFGSNFPVDSLYGDYDSLFAIYDQLTAGYDDDDRADLFAGTAGRVYRV